MSIIVYKVIHENYANFLLNELLPLTNNCPYNIRNNNVFVTPFPRVNSIKLNFIFNAVKVWNELNNNVRQSTSVHTLKTALKNELVDNY